uniref:Putative secreted peptide n=1 Tax=Anopheles braziliensis TaxID=58242 RepID=A0A2M3ZQC8_9DIPT
MLPPLELFSLPPALLVLLLLLLLVLLLLLIELSLCSLACDGGIRKASLSMPVLLDVITGASVPFRLPVVPAAAAAADPPFVLCVVTVVIDCFTLVAPPKRLPFPTFRSPVILPSPIGDRLESFAGVAAMLMAGAVNDDVVVVVVEEG